MPARTAWLLVAALVALAGVALLALETSTPSGTAPAADAAPPVDTAPPGLRGAPRVAPTVSRPAPAAPARDLEDAGDATPPRPDDTLVDERHALPRPPTGRTWVRADALFDPTVGRGRAPADMAWSPEATAGPAAVVAEAIRAHRHGAPWEEQAGARIEPVDGYTLAVRAAAGVHRRLAAWLRDLHWTARPTGGSIGRALAWMRQHGTPDERAWARDALGRVAVGVRDEAEALAETDLPWGDGKVSAATTAPAPRPPRAVRLEARLLRIHRTGRRDLGIDMRSDPFASPPGGPGTYAFWLDDTEWEILERAVQKLGSFVLLASRDRSIPEGAPVALVFDRLAVLHLRARLTDDERFLGLELRAHARGDGALLHTPHVPHDPPDGGALLVELRDVLAGDRPSEHVLALMLRATLVPPDGPR